MLMRSENWNRKKYIYKTELKRLTLQSTAPFNSKNTFARALPPHGWTTKHYASYVNKAALEIAHKLIQEHKHYKYVFERHTFETPPLHATALEGCCMNIPAFKLKWITAFTATSETLSLPLTKQLAEHSSNLSAFQISHRFHTDFVSNRTFF